MQVARLKPSYEPSGDAHHFFEPGHIIAGRYRIRRALGRGGMGSVYLAEDLVLGESGVAIKVLRRDGPEDHSAINRFLREVRLTHKIQHENVVRTFDFGQDGDSIFYTMEYLPGQSLQAAMSAGGLPYRTVADMASQLMRGLAAVHAVGVIHRDLKPANVIVGSDGILKITDFGIARASTAPATMFASDVFGTLRYVAPEILLGEAATRAGDFYALGVLLFELLTGTPPLSEDNPARLILSKIEEQPPSIQTVRGDLPNWLVRGVDGLLDRNPQARMKAVAVFAEALDTHSPLAARFGGRPLAQSVAEVATTPTASASIRPRQTRARVSLLNVLWVALCSLFVMPLSQTEMFSRLEVHHADTLFRLRGPINPHPEVVVVSMDEQSYQRLGVSLTAPWPRALHARLLHRLSQLGARRVVFDVIFADADRNNQEDRSLADAMKLVPTVLGSALGLSQKATINGAFLLEELLQPAEMFETESVGVGVVGLQQQLGRVREFPRAHSEVFPSVSTLSEMAVALDRREVEAVPSGALLNFYGPGRSIPTIPYELVISEEQQGTLPRNLFEGKVVFVGLGLRSSTGASQRDAFITPYDQQTFGAEIHATAASNLLQGSWIRQPSAVIQGAVAVACAGLFAILILSLSGIPVLVGLGCAALCVAGIQFGSFLVGWFIPVATGSVWGIFSGLLLKTVLAQPGSKLGRRRL